MKFYKTFIIAIVFIPFSCKINKTDNKPSAKKAEPSLEKVMTVGTVSHKYRISGCQTVVLVEKPGKKDSSIFIPRLPLNEFDVNGLQIRFQYKILKMPNPKGCLRGTPVELTSVSKK